MKIRIHVDGARVDGFIVGTDEYLGSVNLETDLLLTPEEATRLAERVARAKPQDQSLRGVILAIAEALNG